MDGNIACNFWRVVSPATLRQPYENKHKNPEQCSRHRLRERDLAAALT